MRPERRRAIVAILALLFAQAAIDYGDNLVPGDDLSDDRGCGPPDCFSLAVAFAAPEYKVGYFQAPDPDKVPRMSRSEYLVIRPPGDGWYFFRQN